MERPRMTESDPRRAQVRPASLPASTPRFDLLCLSHLRWDFVYQRPQHLLTRFSRNGRVFFVEEVRWEDDGPARLVVHAPLPNLWVAVPHLPRELNQEQADDAQRLLLDDFLREHDVVRYVLWYYTPMAMGFSRHLTPRVVVYDCMDELSAFRDAPPLMRTHEDALFARADLVFTGGQSLYEAKRSRGPHVYAFPSSVDAAHFARARQPMPDPTDQAAIPHPRLGFFGVIDERMDCALVGAVAAARPDWHLVLIGPTAKIDPADLPQGANIHYLGMKGYDDLPAYLAGWDVALLPFARNESTRFISPTKTPEYLAAGKPVVSTSIRDVVRPYGEMGIVHIADDSAAFVAAVEAALREDAAARLARVDALLAQQSWERTWAAMLRLIEERLAPALSPNALPAALRAEHLPATEGATGAPIDTPTTPGGVGTTTRRGVDNV